MKITLLSVALLCLWAGPVGAQLARTEPARAWKTTDGQTFNASLVKFDGKTVVLKLATGQVWQTPAEKLGEEDAAYLKEWQKNQPINTEIPDFVGVDSPVMKVEVVSEDAATGKYVYRTEHFEFESDEKFATSLLREVGRNFEATYELVKAMPWGVVPEPKEGEYFKAKLIRTRDDYYEAGGPPNSGGVYKSDQGIFLVPFDNIGLRVVGKSYVKDDNFRTHTMVHELTHEMMHHWLRFLPQWLVEGTAEYCGILPLKAGRFRVSAAKTGLKDYLDYLKTVGGIPQPYPLEELFTITNQKWSEIMRTTPEVSHRLYYTSYLLVYYFMELDGKGDRQLIAKYFRTVNEVKEEILAYRKAMEEFKKQPGVEVFADGSFRYPKTLTPPELPAVLATETARDDFQKQTLQILLNGRTEAELMKDIRAAYVRLGIRL